jgi:hypothetical protein
MIENSYIIVITLLFGATKNAVKWLISLNGIGQSVELNSTFAISAWPASSLLRRAGNTIFSHETKRLVQWIIVSSDYTPSSTSGYSPLMKATHGGVGAVWSAQSIVKTLSLFFLVGLT